MTLPAPTAASRSRRAALEPPAGFLRLAVAAIGLVLASVNGAAEPVRVDATVSPARAGADIAVERMLPNGLKVIVKPDHRAPTVAHMVWYRAGSIDEASGRTGVAHVLEHMMFKGTRSLGPGEFSKRVAALGGRENAFTSQDYTGYFQQIHKDRLDEVMALESDRMGDLVLSKEEFEREIRVVMEERRWRTDDKPLSRVYEQLMATAFVAAPTRTPIVGWMADLESMTVEDARDWYHRWYAPNNAVLVVAGDVEPEAVFRLAQKHYGRWPSRTLAERKPQAEPEQPGVRRISVKAPAENPYVTVAFHVPRLRDVERDVEPYALELLSSVLDGHDSARFTRDLVRGTRLASSAGASYDMTGRGPSLFILDATPSAGRTTSELEEAMRAQLRRIATEGVPEVELARAKNQYVAAQIYKRDSVFAQAMEAAQLEISGFSHRDADRILERIRAVTSDQVRAVAAKYFGDDRMTVATLLPQPLDPAVKRPAAPPAGVRH